MSRSLPILLPALSMLLAAGCVGDGNGLSKDDARQLGGKTDSGDDVCAQLGWYGDGVCDAFCALPDPDCAACPDPDTPGVDYISEDPLQCAAITFECPDGQASFSDDCGCGCLLEEGLSCPDAADPAVDYISDDPLECAAILFDCPEGETPFTDVCGCGCIADQAPTCPDPADPSVHYVADSDENPDVCLLIDFACDADQTPFDDACGCGCIDDDPMECPDPDDPAVHYIGDSHENPALCGVITFGCEEDQTLFTDECGCGCIDEL